MVPMIKRLLLTISPEKDSELDACEYLDAFTKKCGFLPETVDEMRLAFIEALINGKEHANKLDPENPKDVLAAISSDGDSITIEVRDFGMGFDPTIVEKPDIKKKLKSANKRGWGLMLMEKLSDGMEINSFPPAGTLITLVKKRAKVEPTETPDLTRERKRIERLKYVLGSFIDLSSFLCQNRDLESGLRSMLRILLGTLGVSRGAIYVLDPGKESFSCAVDIKLKARERAVSLPLKSGDIQALVSHESLEVLEVLNRVSPVFRENFAREEVACVYLLRNEADVLGLLALGPRFRSDEEDLDAELLGTLARNISTAINTFKLMEQLKATNLELDIHIKELDAVRNASQSISSVLEIENLPQTVERIFSSVMDIGTFSLALQESSENKFKLCQTAGRELPEIIDLWASPVSRHVLQSMESLFISDLTKDNRFSYPRANKYKSKSFIVIPIVIQDEVMGIVSLTDRVDGRELNLHDFEMAQLLCGQLNIAIRNANLYKLGFTDSLTRLYAPSYFKIRLSQEVSRLRRVKSNLGIIMLDIDHFKKINEEHGALAGNLLLSKMGTLLRRLLRFNDIPCRYDGEKFVVILPDTDIKGSLRVAEKLRSAIESQAIISNGVELRCTASFGVSVFEPKMSMEQLIELSERAMREAKNKGRNTICS
ncbi:MAG: diguanylate cyclase [Candidatus Riflebacteria bacterium]|nr:diguanylate cyclase [Candidatus Riflebacteria bacterium]